MTIPPLWSPALPPDPEQVEVADEPAADEYVRKMISNGGNFPPRAVPAQNYAAQSEGAARLSQAENYATPAASSYSSAPPLPTVIKLPLSIDTAEVIMQVPIKYTAEAMFLPLHGIWAFKVIHGSVGSSSWVYQASTGWREVPPDVQRSINAATK